MSLLPVDSGLSGVAVGHAGHGIRRNAPAKPAANFETENRGNIRDFNHQGVDAVQDRDKTNAVVGNKVDFSNHLPSADEMANPSTPEMKATMDAEFAKTNAYTENQNKLNSGSSDVASQPADYSAPTPMVKDVAAEQNAVAGPTQSKRGKLAPGVSQP